MISTHNNFREKRVYFSRYFSLRAEVTTAGIYDDVDLVNSLTYIQLTLHIHNR